MDSYINMLRQSNSHRVNTSGTWFLARLLGYQKNQDPCLYRWPCYVAGLPLWNDAPCSSAVSHRHILLGRCFGNFLVSSGSWETLHDREPGFHGWNCSIYLRVPEIHVGIVPWNNQARKSVCNSTRQNPWILRVVQSIPGYIQFTYARHRDRRSLPPLN